MNYDYDIAVIGGGPAGYTAALYAARYGFSVAVFEKQAAGGQMSLTADIENYPGFDEGVAGYDLALKMKAGAARAGAISIAGEITGAELKGTLKRLTTGSGDVYCRAVIIATGAEPRHLNIYGEKELTGHGVSYCAECDGSFFRNKTVAVAGGGNTAVQEALYLSRICKRVYLIHRRDTLRAMKSVTDIMSKTENITPVLNGNITRLYGKSSLEGIEVTYAGGNKESIDCDGLFIAIGRIPMTKLFEKQINMDNQGYIIADETTRTGIHGVFAAGDVRTKELRQIVTAVSDGANAAFCAERYLTGSI